MSQDHHYLQEHSDEVAPTYLELANAEPSQEDYNNSDLIPLQDESNDEQETSTGLQDDEPLQEDYNNSDLIPLQDESNDEQETSTGLQDDEPLQEPTSEAEEFDVFGKCIRTCLDAKASAYNLGAHPSTPKEKNR